jgi:hypothetical protein
LGACNARWSSWPSPSLHVVPGKVAQMRRSIPPPPAPWQAVGLFSSPGPRRYQLARKRTSIVNVVPIPYRTGPSSQAKGPSLVVIWICFNLLVWTDSCYLPQTNLVPTEPLIIIHRDQLVAMLDREQKTRPPGHPIAATSSSRRQRLRSLRPVPPRLPNAIVSS